MAVRARCPGTWMWRSRWIEREKDEVGCFKGKEPELPGAELERRSL